MMWLQAHWLSLFTAWVALNMVVSPLAAKVPATGVWGKALHVFVAVSPMDVMKAIKTVGASVTVPLAVACLLLLGCASTDALASYRAESLDCVSKATTKVEADLCRAAVEARYCGAGGTLADAGACGDAQ